jgi:hypothetical protein
VARDASVPLKASRIAAVVIADVQPACVSSNSPADSHSNRQGQENALLGSLVFIAVMFMSLAVQRPDRLARGVEVGG